MPDLRWRRTKQAAREINAQEGWRYQLEKKNSLMLDNAALDCLGRGVEHSSDQCIWIQEGSLGFIFHINKREADWQLRTGGDPKLESINGNSILGLGKVIPWAKTKRSIGRR